MSRNSFVLFVLVGIVALCLTAIGCADFAMAQAPKPKADKPAAAKALEKKPDAEQSALLPTSSDEPAVAAILETRPTTPEECVRAATTLADLKRADLAKAFLKKALEAKLNSQQLADLNEQVGSDVFFVLADKPELQPEAKQLANAVAAAVKARLEDGKRIAGLVEQLQDASPEKRLQALVGLQESQGAAIAPLLTVLADPTREAEYANVRAALVEIGRVAVDPLVAVVEGADPKLVVQAIHTLGAINNTRDTRMALCLLRPCLSEKSDPAVREAATAALKQLSATIPSRAEAVRLLTDAAIERSSQVASSADGKVALWRWDAAKRQCVSKACTPGDVARSVAVSQSHDAHALAPDDAVVRALWLAAMLEEAAYQNGLDRPLDEKNRAMVEAKQFGVKPVEEVLKYAMAHGRPASATAAARLLGQIGNATELLYQGTGPAPLVQAVRSTDRRLRMAALESIVRLQPTQPFAGSSYVPQALAFLAGSSGFRHALVASGNLADGRELAGRLGAAGYETDTFTTGKELLLQAARLPDYEVALIDMTIDRPVADILVQQLRHDPRTASLRVGFIAKAGHPEQAEHLARLDPLAKAFAQPQDDKAFRWQLEQLATLSPDEFVDFEARQRQAAKALDLLMELSRSSSKLYDLRGVQEYVIAAVYNPKLAAKVMGILADINSAESQRALIEVASRATQPLALRQAAAKAFRQNTQKYGILLTTEEIRRQYTRFNESEKQDAATQHVLGLILDCLEVGVPKKK